MQISKMTTMFQLRILFLIIINCISFAQIKGQGIRAELQNTSESKDNLVITITLRNMMGKPVYIVCPVNVLICNDYMPDRANYGSFESDVEARKKNQSIVKHGNVEDILKLIMPIIKERFQIDANGNEVDIFKTLSNLQEISNNKKMSLTVPLPLDDSICFSDNFLDLDLYELIQETGVVYDENNSSFFEQTIILKPNEEKRFDIDLGYLLLRKATYEISFDYKTDNKLLKKETEFLRQYGFSRYKGRITSNVINIVSE